MAPLYIESIGLVAPGLDGWEKSCSVLQGKESYESTELPKYIPGLLRPNERRRTTPLIKMSLRVAEQALEQVSFEAKDLCSVFASSEGDTEIVDKINTALTLPDKPVSPTQFHNSVHNAPAGYWAIATGSQKSSSSISAGPYSFVAGLIEASCLASEADTPVLLVCYDLPAPPPLKAVVSIDTAFATALLLTTKPGSKAIVKITLDIIKGEGETKMDMNSLDVLRRSNPAARSLPLLAAIATQVEANYVETSVKLPFATDQHVNIKVAAC